MRKLKNPMRRLKNPWIWTLALVFMVAGCASSPLRQETHAPGVAQSVVKGTPDDVAKALIEEMTARQFALTGRDDNILAFDRPIDNAALWPLLDGAPNALPRARVVMTLRPVGGATQVSAQMLIVAAPGTPRERLVDVAVLGVDPRVGDILQSAQALMIAEQGTSDPRLALARASLQR